MRNSDYDYHPAFDQYRKVNYQGPGLIRRVLFAAGTLIVGLLAWFAASAAMNPSIANGPKAFGFLFAVGLLLGALKLAGMVVRK